MEAVSLSALRHAVANRAARLPLKSALQSPPRPFDSLGDFHRSPSVSLASFAARVSRGNHSAAPARAAPRRSPIHPPHARQATSAHSVTVSRTDAPHCRFTIRFVHRHGYQLGSTSAHKNGSPREQGRVSHAIGRRPEPASARSASARVPVRRKAVAGLRPGNPAGFPLGGPRRVRRNGFSLRERGGAAVEGADALPPSTHPKLGATSRRQRFHRYALQRIFRPSLGNGGSD